MEQTLSKSQIVSFLQTGYRRVESAIGFSRRTGAQRFVMRATEKSLLLERMRGLWIAFSNTSISSFGVCLLLYALGSMVFAYGASPQDLQSEWLRLLFVLLVSAPMLAVRQSLGYTVRHSRLLGGFFFGFCGFSRFSCRGEKKGIEHPWYALICACILVILRLRLSGEMLWGGMLLLAFVLLLFSLPELGVLGTLTLLPFLEYLPHPTLTLVALVGLTMAAWLWKTLCGRRHLCARTVDRLVALFAFSCLLATFTGVGSIAQGMTSALLIAFFFPVRNLLLQLLWRKRTVWGVCISGTVTSMLGVAEYLLGYAALKWVDVARFSDIGGRVCGPFSNPNMYAVYLLGIAPILLRELLASVRPIGWRVFCGVGFLAACGAILLTFTRGAWLGILVAVFLFFLCLSRRSAALLALSTVPVCALLPMLPQNLLNRFLSIGSLGESSICYRLHTWRGVWRLVRAHPFGIGVGEQAFLLIYPHYAVSGTERVMHAHNLYLQITAEQGVVGLLLFFAFLSLLALCAVCQCRDLHLRTERLGYGCALTGILVMGLFDCVWYHFGMLCLFFALAALLTLPTEEAWEREVAL